MNESYTHISSNLRTLIAGLTQNGSANSYEAYKTLCRIGPPAIPQIREAVLQSDWSKVKYREHIRYICGLVGLLHDIDEGESRRLTEMIKEKGCDPSIARTLDSICRFTLKDYKEYNLSGIKVFEHKKLVTKQEVRQKVDRWLRNIPEKDLGGIERIFVLRKEDIEALGNYTPFLYRINVVWDNPNSKWNPISWLNSIVIEHTVYHEIGHYVHRHKFGQDTEQEDEAERYAAMIFAEHSPRLVCKVGRNVAKLSKKLSSLRKRVEV